MNISVILVVFVVGGDDGECFVCSLFVRLLLMNNRIEIEKRCVLC